MDDARLRELAQKAGITVRWQDVRGGMNDVAPPTLRAVLQALELPTGTAAELNESLANVAGGQRDLPPLVTARIGDAVQMAAKPGSYQLTFEDGTTQDGVAEERPGGALLAGIKRVGYHQLQIGDQRTTLAVAPEQCFAVSDAAPGQRPWGLAAQLYSLRRPGDGGLGDFGALRQFVEAAGRSGAAAVAISPVHAQFSADVNRFSPYSPSSRIMLNVLHAEVQLDDAEARGLEGARLVDWPNAAQVRLAHMRSLFDSADPATTAALREFRQQGGDALETHARFEALHAHLYGADPARWHWRTWPEQFRDPGSSAVRDFAAEHEREVALHAFMQLLADRSLGAAQQAARAAGMPIGLIADLAVGADSGGSHCWSRQAETLTGLTVGAPPDLLSAEGQSWGLAAFSPRGLMRSGFSTYLEMLRSAMRHAGGIRIDHVMGLARLWVVPDGAAASEGAYLAFPLQDLLRLVALESVRNRAIVLGEDLGTVPDGFSEQLQEAGILGMRVLWFERHNGLFTEPSTWTRGAAGLTTTHDLPTVAGWWAGRDDEWRNELGLSSADTEAVQEERQQDRRALWNAFRHSGAAEGEAPPIDDGPAMADAAVRHVGSTGCELVIIPVEDALALVEQPNLPGTLDQHPNWRRRLDDDAATLLDDPGASRRLASLAAARASS